MDTNSFNFLFYFKKFLHKRKKIFFIIFSVLFMFLLFIYFFPLPESRYSSPFEIENLQGKFVDLDDYRGYVLFKESALNENKGSITFIHGFGGSIISWRNNIDYFTNIGFSVLAIDLKGFGLSEKKRDTNYDHISQAEYIKQILDKFEIEKTHIVAHSMGANIALHFALKYPEKLKSISLVSPALVLNNNFFSSFFNFLNITPFSQLFRQLITRILTYENFETFLINAYFKKELVTEDVVNMYFKPLEIKNWDLALLGIIRDSTKNSLPKNVFDFLKSQDNFKIQIVWGEYDSIISIQEGLQLNKLFENAIFRIMRNTGHMPMEENSSEFNRLLEIFLLSV